MVVAVAKKGAVGMDEIQVLKDVRNFVKGDNVLKSVEIIIDVVVMASIVRVLHLAY